MRGNAALSGDAESAKQALQGLIQRMAREVMLSVSLHGVARFYRIALRNQPWLSPQQWLCSKTLP